ncbi:MAG: hypothetical protein EXR99_10775 [Gemmataceae bacterium]|nr:hypothetical protein [Gemmataceae bacterium]
MTILSTLRFLHELQVFLRQETVLQQSIRRPDVVDLLQAHHLDQTILHHPMTPFHASLCLGTIRHDDLHGQTGQGHPNRGVVSSALERVQGPVRNELNKYRNAASKE